VLVPAMFSHCINLPVTVNQSGSNVSIKLIGVAPGIKVVEPANGTVVPPGNEGDTSAYVWFEVDTGPFPIISLFFFFLTLKPRVERYKSL